ncbi:MAG TPA: AcvB/VirJ family lysyl-phosphatidylglycerol hydrolase [Thermoanaerobaculia bacterium]|nr:AcvB/VirJ family lysyl-phosphatidylglycerol hydrolase [Thermoanaerobaculia bacterium]
MRLICSLFFLVAVPALAAGTKPLPLVEVPSPAAGHKLFALMVSGDGGWAKIDKEISAQLAGGGIPVVGLNALQYFWTKRDPDTLSRDLASVIETYRARWNTPAVVLIGYSRGADVLPFAVSRMPEAVRKRIALVALLSPSRSATFEFKVADWFKDRNGVPTRPEIDKLRGTKTICVYGTDDRETVCTEVDARVAHPIALSGSHHFDRDYGTLAKIITTQVAVP